MKPYPDMIFLQNLKGFGETIYWVHYIEEHPRIYWIADFWDWLRVNKAASIKINKIPEELNLEDALSKVTEIVISGSFIDLPKGIDNFKSLKKVFIKNECRVIYRDALSDTYEKENPNRKLNDTDLFVRYEYRLDKLPMELFNLINLEELVISGTNITQLSKKIGQLINLKKLVVEQEWQLETLMGSDDLVHSDCNISNLPLEISYLTKLEELHIVGCGLSSLPWEIGKLVNLKILNINSTGDAFFGIEFNNNLTELPYEICRLKNLTEFNYDRNISLTSEQLDFIKKTFPSCDEDEDEFFDIPF